jgi:hypothetical protein
MILCTEVFAECRYAEYLIYNHYAEYRFYNHYAECLSAKNNITKKLSASYRYAE